jgi:hypothetical protein
MLGSMKEKEFSMVDVYFMDGRKRETQKKKLLEVMSKIKI